MRHSRWLAVFACAATCISLQAHAVTAAQARAKAYAWLVQQQKGDGSWVDTSNNQFDATALAAQSMGLSGLRYGYVTGAASAWLQNGEPRSVDAMARRILALAAVGIDTTGLAMQLWNARSVGQGSTPVWGAYPGYTMAMPDTAIALEAMQAAGRSEASSTVTVLNALKRSDGGWGYGSPQLPGNSSLIPTAEAVRVLSNYVIAVPSAKSGADAIVNAGVNWILARKKNDGGFAEDAKSDGTQDPSKAGQSLETAMAWNALNAAKLAGFTAAQTTQATTVLTGAETFLLNHQSADGSYGSDAMTTASVLRIWSSSALTDTDHDGVPDAVEALLGTNVNVADARGLPKGNGNPVPPDAAADADGGNADTPTLPEWGAILLGAGLLAQTWRRQRVR